MPRCLISYLFIGLGYLLGNMYLCLRIKINLGIMSECVASIGVSVRTPRGVEACTPLHLISFIYNYSWRIAPLDEG